MATWNDFLNPNEQFDLDPETGQYRQTTPQIMTQAPDSTPPPPSGGAMWDGMQIGGPDYLRTIEEQLRAAGGPMYDPTDLEGFIRNAQANQAPGGWANAGAALQNQLDIYRQRDPRNEYGLRPNEPRGGGGAGGGGTQLPGFQFDDAYTNLLEQIAQRQLGEVRSSPALDSLMQFLTQQFQDLSTTPGYNPGELAMLRTQALEPIEANRQASMQRARERAAARGFAPSSGLMELDLRDIERAADQARTVAGRDLAIAGLDRRDRDLSRALDLGQLMALTIPRAQRAEELGIGNLLYQMPRTALQDALSVISGTPSSQDAFSQALQLLQQQYDQQGRADRNNAALFSQIGQILASLFR
jgi:hypothetical protein